MYNTENKKPLISFNNAKFLCDGRRNLALFVLWEGALPKQNAIMDSLANKFRIIGDYSVLWSDKHYKGNAQRLYERFRRDQPFIKYSKKLGKPPFRLIVVEDDHPEFGFHSSISGEISLVNKNITAAKSEFRELFSEKYQVHSSNDLDEFYFQASMIIGPDRLGQLLKSREIIIDDVDEDLQGASGWSSWDHFLSVVNYSTAHVFLRDTEGFKDVASDGDVDILAADFQRFCSSANIIQSKNRKYKGRSNISSEDIKFDVRFIGDGYMPESWQQEILITRGSKRGVYTPSDENMYFSLLYHICLHKSGRMGRHEELLVNLERNLNCSWSVRGKNEDELSKIVRGFLEHKHYIVRKPFDQKVQINQRALQNWPTPTEFERKRWYRSLWHRIGGQ